MIKHGRAHEGFGELPFSLRQVKQKLSKWQDQARTRTRRVVKTEAKRKCRKGKWTQCRFVLWLKNKNNNGCTLHKVVVIFGLYPGKKRSSRVCHRFFYAAPRFTPSSFPKFQMKRIKVPLDFLSRGRSWTASSILGLVTKQTYLLSPSTFLNFWLCVVRLYLRFVHFIKINREPINHLKTVQVLYLHTVVDTHPGSLSLTIAALKKKKQINIFSGLQLALFLIGKPFLRLILQSGLYIKNRYSFPDSLKEALDTDAPISHWYVAE